MDECGSSLRGQHGWVSWAQADGSGMPGAEPDAGLFAARPEAGVARVTPSLLVLGEGNRQRWARLAQAAGGRLLDAVALDQALARLAHIVDVDAVLLRCRGDEPGLETLAARLDALSMSAGVRLIIHADLPAVDRLYGVVQARGALLLCDAREEELAAALCAGLAGSRHAVHLHDPSRADDEAERLERLTDQVGRLARTIEALMQDRPVSTRPVLFGSPRSDYAPPPEESDEADASFPVDAVQVRALLRVRRMRDPLFPPDLFADPAWDIMLDLLAAHLEGRRVSVSSLCIAAAVPPTTALRWIRQLTDDGLLERRADPEDGRRVFITLSSTGLQAMRRWFAASRPHLREAVRQD